LTRVAEVGADHPRRLRCKRCQVDPWGERNASGVDAQDGRPARQVGRVDRDPPVEAAGTQQRGCVVALGPRPAEPAHGRQPRGRPPRQPQEPTDQQQRRPEPYEQLSQPRRCGGERLCVHGHVLGLERLEQIVLRIRRPLCLEQRRPIRRPLGVGDRLVELALDRLSFGRHALDVPGGQLRLELGVRHLQTGRGCQEERAENPVGDQERGDRPPERRCAPEGGRGARRLGHARSVPAGASTIARRGVKGRSGPVPAHP
jgi:hypothetical protein